MTKKTIIGATLGVFGCLLGLASAIVGSGFLVAKSSKETIWMDGLSDAASLATLSLPGSHDSGALKSMAGIAGKCQDAPIEEQLKMGVRFLDIRLTLRNDTLQLVHGDIDQNTKYSDVVRQVDSFLDAHPSEFVLASVKEETKATGSSLSFEEALEKVSSEALGERFYKESDLPSTVGEARGKVILLSRYRNPNIGLDCQTGWADGGEENATCMFTLPSCGIEVQDHYKLENCDDKIAEVKATLENSSANALTFASPLYLNFFSGYLGSGFPPSYAVPVAEELNRFALEHIEEYACTGVTVFDFVSNDLCDKVIGRNFA